MSIRKNKEWLDEFNPFNSWKLMAHVHRWEGIQKGWKLPPPATVSIDPMNLCDEKCIFCNADFVLDSNKGSRLEKEIMDEIPEFLQNWKDERYGVETVCVGGGGEALLNKYSGNLILELVKRGIGVGVVTNGTQIDKRNNLEALSQCDWVGVSINAGTRETYEKIHQKDEFDHVISNVGELVRYSDLNKTNLSKIGRGPGVSWKYLLHPYNVREVVQATNLAKKKGFRNIHIRPVSVPWFDLRKGKSPHEFRQEHIEKFGEEISEAMEYNDEEFGVFGVTHKFKPDFTPANDFKKCYSIFMNGVIMPPSGRNKGEGRYDWGCCCDRRGDDLLTGIKNGREMEEIKNFWGSKEHWEMFEKIDVKKCPRCTFSPHNKIYQEAILKNNLTYDFI